MIKSDDESKLSSTHITADFLSFFVFPKSDDALDYLFIVKWPDRVAQSEAHLTQARGPGFYTRSVHILSFLVPLVQEVQMSVMAKVCARSTG